MIIKIDDMVTYRSLENKKSSGDPDANTEINLLACKLYDNDETVQVGQKRLFNENLINETINFMTQQLAKIRIAKQTGGDVKAAIAATNEEVLRAQAPTNTMGRVTNDPMLANMASEANSNVMNNNFQNVAVNPQEVVNRNTDPFSTPPAAHLNQVT
jgi:hypothetical protein